MRLRNVKGSRETIDASPWTIHTPSDQKGCWCKEVFCNTNPIHIEIGMGKGQFLMSLASQNPEINYIGIEKYSSVLVRALEKMEENPVSNLRFLCVNAEELPDIFAPGEVAQIYLNFSDPWPKDRHAKRRLTSKEFLARYEKILLPDGVIIFKTDNRPLFEFSLEQVTEAGWKLRNSTFDLHNSEYKEGNIMTEYETKFVAEGKPICRMVIARNI
ncbi:MAG: tRNA (guanosine(46)-N7)-methyltransferase TrmB [Lachnospiraceae bacterium]|nr:tRNA (guanosine(46)-N7)-methyltransferase TrmB [Lachnospiraceae bacterium]